MVIVASIICIALGVFFIDKIFRNEDAEKSSKERLELTKTRQPSTHVNSARKTQVNSHSQSTQSSQNSGIDPLVTMSLINNVVQDTDDSINTHRHHGHHPDACEVDTNSYNHHHVHHDDGCSFGHSDYTDHSCSDMGGGYDSGCDCGGSDY